MMNAAPSLHLSDPLLVNVGLTFLTNFSRGLIDFVFLYVIGCNNLKASVEPRFLHEA